MDGIAIVSGFCVGAIVGRTGVGGGSLSRKRRAAPSFLDPRGGWAGRSPALGVHTTPLLPHVFKLNPAAATGTDRWLAAITTTAGSAAHHEAGHVDWGPFGVLRIGPVPGTRIGATLTRHLPERLVHTLLCLALVTAGAKVIA